jgi:hypothetical protein
LVATNITVVSSTSITATTPAQQSGSVNVVVTNTNGLSGTLTNGYTYVQPDGGVPSVISVSPNKGPTTGGTSVTITGTSFAAGATVTFGTLEASNVVVVNATTITASTPPNEIGSVNVFVTNTNGQSGFLFKGFLYEAAPETVLLEDDFNDNSLNLSKWTANNLFSGFTDASVLAREINQRFEIGPLFQGQSGSHYNGIRSSSFNFTGAYGFVELVQAPSSSTKADAMFAIGLDAHNYYRIYVEEGVLICQSRIGGTKRNLFTAAFNSLSHRFWRIRHDQSTGHVVFETASSNPLLSGSWTAHYSEPWNNAAVPVTSVMFELKAGTWQVESIAPGTVVFDNFRAARP